MDVRTMRGFQRAMRLSRFLLLHQALHERRRRFVLKVMLMLRMRQMLRERNRIRSISILDDQIECAWYTMYASRDVPSFIAAVSIPPNDFDKLLGVFSKHYIVKSGVGRRGRPSRVIHKHCVLAMVLHFYTHATEAKTICELFAVPPATFSRILSNSEEALSIALREIPDAGIRWPYFEQQEQWADATEAREPRVKGVFAFVDGKNLTVQQP